MQYELDGKTAWVYTGGKPFDTSLPTMVFIHGAEHDHSVWALQSRYLAHHGRSVLAVDLPGHGRSAGPALESIELLADWIAALLRAAGVQKATVVGHSMGSLIAMECAARYPQLIAKLVLVGTAFPMKVSDDLLAATRDDEATAQIMVNLWSHAVLAHFPGSPGPGFWVQGVNRRLMQRQKPGVMHVDFRACNAYTNGLVACAGIKCPVLLVLGKRDVMTPPRLAKEIIKVLIDKRVVEIEGAGHAIMAEKPDELLDAIRSF
ncbi:MAG: alpha/beta hydrolase [Gammaproteobacteria bacterium]|nr:alpha/beta hydrolase [Gammaproteobacteria bacterium]MBM4210012.1 alpha/beta hydrolase [Gammaproteobacteria bacterium]